MSAILLLALSYQAADLFAVAKANTDAAYAEWDHADNKCDIIALETNGNAVVAVSALAASVVWAFIVNPKSPFTSAS